MHLLKIFSPIFGGPPDDLFIQKVLSIERVAGKKMKATFVYIVMYTYVSLCTQSVWQFGRAAAVVYTFERGR